MRADSITDEAERKLREETIDGEEGSIKEIESEKELLELLKKIPFKDNKQRNNIICSLIGHSRISEMCFGYRHCGRCGDLLGDSLAGADYGKPDAVLIGHNCNKCRANYKNCTWKDKIFVKNPFTRK